MVGRVAGASGARLWRAGLHQYLFGIQPQAVLPAPLDVALRLRSSRNDQDYAAATTTSNGRVRAARRRRRAADVFSARERRPPTRAPH